MRGMSRSARSNTTGIDWATADLKTGEGVAAALHGSDTIVHCASDQRGDAASAARLIQDAGTAGVTHLVFPSIVGTDRVPLAYFRAKLDVERVIRGGSVPSTMLRATQFYQFILEGAQRLTRLPVVPVPSHFPVQPVDARDVAVRLVELALDAPNPAVPELVGPEELTFASMIRGYLARIGRHRPVWEVPFPGTREIRNGGLLSSDENRQLASTTWTEFLDIR